MKSIQLTKSKLIQLCYDSGIDNDNTILEIREKYKKQKSIPVVDNKNWIYEDYTFEIEFKNYTIYYNWKLNKLFAMDKLSEAGKNGAKTGKILKDKITFEPNDPPPIFIKE